MSDRTYDTRWKRRLVTVPIVLLGSSLFCALLPLLLPLAVIVDLARKDLRFNAARLTLVLPFYFFAEVLGLAALLLSGLRHERGSEALRASTYAIQGTWTRFILGAIQRGFGLRFHVEQAERLTPGPVIVLVTHSSIVDTLLPTALLSVPLGMRLRFVLKEELLAEPCLDVAGHRVPNCFVSRRGENTELEVARVAALAKDLGSMDGVLIYPEGTRFTPKKRDRALERIAKSDEARAARLGGMRNVLPIQPGGTLALLEAAPDADIVIVAHAGLHGTAEVGDLVKAGLAGRSVALRVTRIERSTLPRDQRELLSALDDRWLEVDAWITERLETRSAR